MHTNCKWRPSDGWLLASKCIRDVAKTRKKIYFIAKLTTFTQTNGKWCDKSVYRCYVMHFVIVNASIVNRLSLSFVMIRSSSLFTIGDVYASLSVPQFSCNGFFIFKCRSETAQGNGGPTEKYEQNFVLLKIIDFPS